MHLKTINMLDHSTCATDVQSEGHTLRRDSYIVFHFVLLFISLSVHFFLPFHIPSYFISPTTCFQEPSFLFLPCSIFVLSFLLCLFICLFYSIFLPVLLLRTSLFSWGNSFVSSPKPSIPAMLSTKILVLWVVFRA